jgi:Acetyltransferase (GNAT) domain
MCTGRKIGLHDAAHDEVSADTLEKLRRLNTTWLGSAGFATLYSYPAVARVCWRTNPDGSIASAWWYREQLWHFGLKKLTFLACAPFSEVDLRAVLAQRHAHMAAVLYVPPDDTEEFKRFDNWCGAEISADDSIIDLPSSAETYLSSLGRKTRKHLPYYVRRLQAEWSDDLEIDCLSKSAISLEDFGRVVDLNRARIEAKGRDHLWTNDMIRARWLLAQEEGILCVVRRKKEIVGGTLSYIHGDEGYLVLIGHDPKYNALNIGNVCLWVTIQRLIGSRVRRYHLLWGKSFYKTQFGGREEALLTVQIARNRWIRILWLLLFQCDRQVFIARRLAKSLISLSITEFRSIAHRDWTRLIRRRVGNA